MTDLCRLALDGLEAVVWLIAPDGSVILCNAASHRLFGRDVTGASLTTDRFDDDLPHLACLAESLRSGLGSPDRLERLIVSMEIAGPRYLWAALAASPGGAGGEAPRALLVQDVTGALTGSASLDKILSQVRHDLRGPLTSVAGSAELMLSGRVGDLPATQRRLATIIEESARRMGAILDKTAQRPPGCVQAATGEGSG